MKTKNIFFLIAVAIGISTQQSVGQPTFTLPVTTVCGMNDLSINVNFPNVYQSFYTYINGIFKPNATMPATPGDPPLNRTGVVIPNTNFASGINTISITGVESRVAYKIPNGAITINGVLDENLWRLNEFVYLVMDANNPIPNGGNSALNFGLLWDDNNLYIGVKVVDTTMFKELINGGGGDGVEIYIDPYNQKGCYTGFCGLDYSTANLQQIVTRQLIVGYNSVNESNLRFWQDNSDAINAGRSISGITMSVVTFASDLVYKLPQNIVPASARRPSIHRGTGFVIEMSIPWESFFGVSTIPGAGHTFGFDMAYNDTQGRPRSDLSFGRNEQLFWESSDNSNNRWQSAQNFGSITLVENSSPIETLLFTTTVLGVKPDLALVAPIISGTCTSGITISIPTIDGFNTYWQTAASLESTLDPTTTPKEFLAPITSLGVFYNARSSGGCWTETNFVSILPANPINTSTILGVTPVCGLAILNASVLGLANTKHFWQTTSTGTSELEDVMLIPSKTVTGASNSFLNIRAYNTLTGCWSIENNSIGIDLSGAKPNAPSIIAGVDLLSSISGACVGKTALVFYTNTPSGSNLWFWQTEPLGTSTGMANDTISVTTTGTSYVRAQLFGCWSDASVGISVDVSDVVIPAPITQNYVYFQNDVTTALGLASVNTLYGINWYADAVTAAPVQTAPVPSSAEIGIKNFFAAYTKDNCESPKSPLTVEIKDIIVLAPARYYGITPNGDLLNNTFKIENIERNTGNKVIITDKWGNVVYEKENYDNSFDGKTTSGKELPFGSYAYIVNLKDGKSFTGTVVITR